MMKRWTMLLMMVMVVVSLAACGNSDTDEGASTNNAPEGDAGNAIEEEDPGETPEDPNYDQAFDILEDNGYEIGDKGAAFADDFGAETAIQADINGEDMLPLQIFKMPEDSDNLKQAHDKGEMTMEFEGQEGQIEVLAIDDYCFFLAEGHPDQADVYDLLEENFEQE